ncbi:hypothetical protein [Nocardia seriolae]|uniref:hypothetical protein n=1 Tax=Nocardia seriolae TaxID=37332 RepID=UPI0011AB2E6E|nr:hypothetical protein [Nocardia seriolae]MTJ61231.1 hypothetical protein [Nocardia seriolae]MTJ69988.1 hypothetical protein [Nocardia seriolae]MTJ90644.1 hypothetical protein [Nocardia seriolae]MTK39208.1 hypothetical protein [Nocardia seriolae]MTK51219.1 hypothetical protein [Nocardia seriolae]
MLEQRDQIGDRLMAGEDILIGGQPVLPPDPMHDGVGHLVRDDVVRQAGENHLSGQIRTRIVGVCLVIAEQHRAALWIEIGVLPLERVRHQSQLLLAPPPEATAHEPLEPFDDTHSDRVDHLLVRPGITLGGPNSILRQQKRRIEIDRQVPPVAAHIEIHHLDEFTVGPLAQLGFEGNVEGEKLPGQPRRHRVECEGAQPAPRRSADFGG